MIKNKKIMTLIAVLTMMAVCLVPVCSDGSDATNNVLEGMCAGDWTWDTTTGLGPFNSFYGAFDINNGNRFVSILDPYDLSKKIDGTTLGSGYNIMWVIPTVYWSVDTDGDLILSNDSTKGTAYAHTIDGHVYKYIAIGVYEATSDNNSSPTKLTSETGKTPLANKTRGNFRTLANAYTMDSSLGANAYSMLWNFYMWELYKYIGLITMEDFNSQTHVGYGHAYTSNSTYTYTTGATDSMGPYAGKIGTWSSSLGDASVKLYLENAWGGVSEWVDGFMMVSGTTIYLDTKNIPTDAITTGTNVESISFAWPSNGFPNAIDTTVKLWGLGTNNSGTDTIGTTDRQYKGTSSSGNVLHVGGYASSDASTSLYYGLSCAYANTGSSYAYVYIGGRVAFVFDADPASNAQKNYTYNLDYDSTAMTTGSNAITSYDMTSGTAQRMRAISHDAPQVTVSIASNDTDYGTVSGTSVTVSQGASYTVSDNTLTIGSTTITATKTTPDTAQYTYGFDGWYVGNTQLPSSGTVTDDMSITARFTATVNNYTVSIQSNNTDYGTVDVGSIPNTPYGSVIHLSGTNDNILTLNGSVVTATASDPNAYYTYGFDGYSTDGTPVQDGDVITGARTIVANFSQTAIYTVLINPNDATYGTVSVDSIIGVPTGSMFTVVGDEITIYSVTSQATPNDPTAQYTFAFDDFYIGSTKVTTGTSISDNTTVTAVFTATINDYTVSIVPNDPTYGSVSPTSIADVPYGTAITVSGNTLSINGTTVTATDGTDTDQYDFAFSGWSVQDGDTTDEDTTITAIFTATVKEYTITWDIDGTTEETSWAYGSTPTHSTPTKQDYVFAGWDPEITAVTGDATYTATWEEAPDILMELVDIIPLILIMGLILTIIGSTVMWRMDVLSINDMVSIVVFSVIGVIMVVVVGIPIINGL